MTRRNTIGRQMTLGVDELAAKISKMQLDNRRMKQALAKELRPVLRDAKRLVPKPGYPGDKPDLKPLVDTISIQTRDYKNRVWYGMVGPEYPAGSHGHLVEGWKAPRANMFITPFIKPAFEKHVKSILKRLSDLMGDEIERVMAKGVKR